MSKKTLFYTFVHMQNNGWRFFPLGDGTFLAPGHGFAIHVPGSEASSALGSVACIQSGGIRVQEQGLHALWCRG
jgi:hypothetical protein